MIWNEYPYSNVHELNLDWILKQVLEGKIKIEEFEKILSELDIEKLVDDYIKEYLDKLLIEATYIFETKSIKLKAEEV